MLQAGRNQTVDILLATLLLVGGVMGPNWAAGPPRALLALILLCVGLRMGLGLFFTPREAFVLMSGSGG